MDIHLIGQTIFELDSYSATIYSQEQLDVNRAADTHAIQLSDHERLLAALLPLSHEPLERRLRNEEHALRFLTYQFLTPYDTALAVHLQSSCLLWTRLPGALQPLVVIQGNLADWITAMWTGTRSDELFVCDLFCHIFVYLESGVGLQTVLSRFYKDYKEIDGRQLFRLRRQEP